MTDISKPYIFIIGGFVGVMLLIMLYYFLYENTLNTKEEYEQHIYAKSKEEFISKLIHLSDICYINYYNYPGSTTCFKIHTYLKDDLYKDSLPTTSIIKGKEYNLKYVVSNNNFKGSHIYIMKHIKDEGVTIYEIE